MDARERKGREGEDGAQREEGARVCKAPSPSGERGLGKPRAGGGGGEKGGLRVYPEMPSGILTIVRQNEGL